MSHNIVLVALFTALTAAGSMIRIPLLPVPVTLQTLFVYLSGAFLGSRHGAYSQLLFLCIGLAGAPVFARGGGPGYVLQPTFGYLLAFPAAAWVAGKVRVSGEAPAVRRRCWIFGAAAGIILIFGSFYMWCIFKYISGADVSAAAALWTGTALVLPGEALKIAGACLLLSRLGEHMGR